MWIVVKDSEKSIKSDYFGVIIYIWWRSFQKIGIFTIKMLNTLSIDVKTLNIREFPPKLHSLSILCAEYFKNSGHSVQFFQKIGKFTILCTNNHKSNTLVGENSEKLGFSKNSKQFLQNFCNFICGSIRV